MSTPEICAKLLAKNTFGPDPDKPGVVLIYDNPDGPEAATIIAGLYAALEDLLVSRSVNPSLVVGKHPIDGHDLNAEGMAAVKAETLLLSLTDPTAQVENDRG